MSEHFVIFFSPDSKSKPARIFSLNYLDQMEQHMVAIPSKSYTLKGP